MKEVISIVKDEEGNEQALFICPGCGGGHAPYIKGTGVPVWGFNNDLVKPTFTPSILVKGHLGEVKGIDKYGICHSFVTDGKIKFLTDCTHELAGKTVDIKPI
ncbi:MAG: DUF6527 family protein [Polaribacter sp.]|uniref:DUF6527 family protein n=1 Tax=Polaribacter sp. TaxID=1920175 RepID=UPI002F359128